MRGLNDHLLHADNWTDDSLSNYQSLVHDIQSRWKKVTGIDVFPKIHMLTHTYEFAQRFKCLGRVGETYIESSHVMFNKYYNELHINMKNNKKERLRRSLAETTVRAMRKVAMMQ